GGGLLQAEERAGLGDLRPGTGEAGDGAGRMARELAEEGGEVAGGLEAEVALPELGDDAGDGVTLERGEVRALTWFAPVHEPGAPGVGAEEHRGVGERAEEGLEGGFVAGAEEADGGRGGHGRD